MSIDTASGPLGGPVGQVGEELVQGGGVLARGAPHDLRRVVIRHQGQVLVVLTPGNLIDTDIHQIRQAIRVEDVTDHAFADRPDGAPRDPGETAHGGLVGLGYQPRHQILEIPGESRPRPRERHPLSAHAMLRAPQPPAPHLHPAHPPGEVEMPPRRVDLTGVIAVRRRERTQRAHQQLPRQPDGHQRVPVAAIEPPPSSITGERARQPQQEVQ